MPLINEAEHIVESIYSNAHTGITDHITQQGLPISCFQKWPIDGAESVLLHKSSNKSSNMLLHKPISAPSFGRY